MYWQYEVMVIEYDDIGFWKMVPRQGVVIGKDKESAIKELKLFYNIEEIIKLQAITDSIEI